MFSEARETGDVVPLDWARKLRDSERTNRRLKSRLDQILSEHESFRLIQCNGARDLF